VGTIGELVRSGRGAEEQALEAVFDSLGRACVQHLVAAPHPLGLPPRDRLVAERWLSRRSWTRHWRRDLLIVLVLVGLGLAASLLLISLAPAAEPLSDAVQRPAQVMAHR
jgi:hypothetical protein